VRFDGLAGHEQGLGYFAVGAAFGGQHGDAPLARRQRVPAIVEHVNGVAESFFGAWISR
jgi:hypothetical protein